MSTDQSDEGLTGGGCGMVIDLRVEEYTLHSLLTFNQCDLYRHPYDHCKTASRLNESENFVVENIPVKPNRQFNTQKKSNSAVECQLTNVSVVGEQYSNIPSAAPPKQCQAITVNEGPLYPTNSLFQWGISCTGI